MQLFLSVVPYLPSLLQNTPLRQQVRKKGNRQSFQEILCELVSLFVTEFKVLWVSLGRAGTQENLGEHKQRI